VNTTHSTLLFALWLLSLGRVVGADTGTVIQVLDGDTCRLHDGREVRYLGIDAPESGDPWAEEATAAHNKLVANRSVRLEGGRPAEDRNGRFLAYAFVGQTFVNEELVRQGVAHVRRPVSTEYRQRLPDAQDEARLAGRGIWAGASNVSLAITDLQVKQGRGQDALNNEYVVIQNRGSNAVDITGWSLLDEGNHRYLFPNFVLGPDAKVSVRTGVGQNTATDLYWGSRTAIWNDTGDTIFIKDTKGRLVLSHVY
jgi:endonuclease YncB( thermonuclease family)